jgi:carboxypeptidase C (cathepsin A)
MTLIGRLALLAVAAVMMMFVPAGPGALAAAQKQAKESAPAAETKKAEAKPTPEPPVPKEESSVTEHTIRIAGQTIPYKATASTILLKNDKSDPIASIFSIAYVRTDVKNSAKRPVAFIYNGGPGSASLWLHMGAFGPRRVITESAAPTGPAPYQLVDNDSCLLDKADLVFIDPVGTGFSRAVGKGKNKDFWGVDQDVKSLAQFLGTWVNRNNRWNSPKFLIGESYGTFRSVALANYLQAHDGMYINGIVLISSVLNINTLEFNTADDMPYIFYLPSYAASAWYYKTLKNRADDLNTFLNDARAFAANEYAAALMKGANLSDAEKAGVAKKLSAFTGLSEEYLINANLRVKLSQFEAELERSRKLTVGRYDSRYSGPTYDLLTEHAEYDPSYIAVNGAFTAAINKYLREDLKFSPELTYETLSYEVNRHWDWKHNPGRDGDPSVPSVNDDLVQAVLSNASLQVEVENGYFDLATPFFATEYTMDHLGLPPKLRSRIHLDYYASGHMIYLNEEELPRLKKNVANFIDGAAKQ